jgi:hypothetical protein
MKPVRALLAFLYDFLVGDDPLIALSVIAALAATAALTSAGINAWWILPPSVVFALALSLLRATRTRSSAGATSSRVRRRLLG